MVSLAPRIQTPCPGGAISGGAPASTGTASPCPTPAAAKPPAIRRARSCTSPQVCRTGQFGSPVTKPFELDWAVPYIVSVNLLKTIPLAAGRGAAVGLRLCVGAWDCGRACTSEANASALSHETFSEIAGVPALLIPPRYQCRPSGNEVDNDGSGRACPSSRTPPMVPQSDRDEVSSMSRHTDGTYSPATGNRPPGRTDVADNPLTVGLTDCADTLRRGF